ncbi:MAG: hypothetical protein WD577_10205 [Bacteroidales bacterium]
MNSSSIISSNRSIHKKIRIPNAGEHTVYIRVHDMFGREYTAERKFTIVAR